MSWYESKEHIEALGRHDSPVLVKHMRLYFIYKYDVEKIASMLVSDSLGKKTSKKINKRVMAKYGEDYEKKKGFVDWVDSCVDNIMPLANTGTGDNYETTLENWYASIVMYFKINSNMTIEEIDNMPYLAINEFKVACERIHKVNSKKAFNIYRASQAVDPSGFFMGLEQHLKRKSPEARKRRAEKAKKDRSGF